MEAQAPDWVFSNFAEFERGLNGDSASPLHSLRRLALARFQERGFPTSKDEDWKYTNIKQIAQGNFKLSRGSSVAGKTSPALEFFNAPEVKIPGLAATRLVFVNGVFREDLSDSVTGLSLTRLADLKKKPDLERLVLEQFQTNLNQGTPLASLNTAFVRDGLVLQLARENSLSKPLIVLNVTGDESESFATLPRLLVIAEEGAKATVIEQFVGGSRNPWLTCPVTQLILGPNSKLNYLKLSLEGPAGYHLGQLDATLERDSQLAAYSFNFGSAITRNEARITIKGENVDAKIGGLSIANESQLIDNFTIIDHAAPRSQSTQLFKGIYSDNARGVFNGTIIVRPDAQKTNAIQSSRSVLLSDKARVDTKPQLKIWADDVKCTHGATVGQLDDAALFYIRSRGVPEKAAKQILLHAFAGEVVQAANFEQSQPLREYLEAQILSKLGW